MRQVFANALIAGSCYSLVALGFGFIWSVTRFFNFAHGAIYSASAYAAYIAVKQFHMPLPVGIVIGVFIGTACGIAVEAVCYRPLRRRNATSVVLLLSSLGVLIVIQNFISLLFGDQPRILRMGGVSEGVVVLAARFTKCQIAIVLTNVLLLISTWTVLWRTRFGRAIRAVADDPDLAEIHGVDVNRAILYVFAAGSAVAAIAAILIGLDTDLTPAMGFNALLMGAAATIVGGAGKVKGAFAGGFVVGVVQHFGVWKLQTEWQDAVVFVVVILFLILRPQGIVGGTLKSARA